MQDMFEVERVVSKRSKKVKFIYIYIYIYIYYTDVYDILYMHALLCKAIILFCMKLYIHTYIYIYIYIFM